MPVPAPTYRYQMADDRGTWHHGLIARYWADFTVATAEELLAYRGAIERFGEPALDLGCGTGRILVPLLAEGFDVDGVDISEDMLAWCRKRATQAGFEPRLELGAMHELDLRRRYRTIYICDSFGIGGDRANDLEALRRVHRHLEPGGALVFSHWLPYEGLDERSWSRWLPSQGADLPRPWPESGERHVAADGDELELINRLADLDPFLQRHALEIRARLWRGSELIAEEERALLENLYFVPELRLMLETAGFTRISVEGGYSGRPATRDDGMVVFVAER